MASGSACPTKFRYRSLLTINGPQITAALLHAAVRTITGHGTDRSGSSMAPTILTGVGAAASAVPFGGIVIVVARASAARQAIQDQSCGTDTGSVHERERAVNGVARSFSGPHHHAGGVNMRYHKKGIAHRQDRRAVDHDAIKFSYRGADQFLEAITT